MKKYLSLAVIAIIAAVGIFIGNSYYKKTQPSTELLEEYATIVSNINASAPVTIGNGVMSINKASLDKNTVTFSLVLNNISAQQVIQKTRDDLKTLVTKTSCENYSAALSQGLQFTYAFVSNDQQSIGNYTITSDSCPKQQ